MSLVTLILALCIMRCPLCGKPVREISYILQKSKSTVSDIIEKWRHSRGDEVVEKRSGKRETKLVNADIKL
ncbi:hypothetical protein TNCV_4837251 [Trichonephila clavipes]|nr:hypothetical protein TNCV_4837251 [Trichonephila clavipes]